jgi:Exonuclease
VIILYIDRVKIEDALFSEFVKPTRPIPPFITELTSITNEDVSTAEPFAVVGDAFIRFMQQHTNEFGAGMVEQIILVGHNGKGSDIPFLIHQLGVHGIQQRFLEDRRFHFGMGPLQIARKGICDDKTGVGVPTAYNLPTFFQFVSGTLLSTSRCTMADVKATATVFRYPFWGETRTERIFKLSTSQDQQQQGCPIAIRPPEQLDNDSDSESGDLESSQSGGVQSVLLPLQQVQRMKISPVPFLWECSVLRQMHKIASSPAKVALARSNST